MPKYSFIVPVYNRPDEVDELLQSLTAQRFRDFVHLHPLITVHLSRIKNYI